MIASGSTCTVYKGKYKNNLVAIKKIQGVMDQEKMKFMKEFKREVTLLVSTPNQQNLITLLGFAIKDDEVCLVSEYCEGGCLFDILYKRFYSFRLT